MRRIFPPSLYSYRLAYALLTWTLLALPTGLAAASALPSRPPFTLIPLIQPGSLNLISPDFKTWDTHGDVQITTAEGNPALQLGPRHDKDSAGFRLSTPAKPNTLYELTFRYRLSNDLQWDYAHDNEGLDGWLVAQAKGKDLRDTRLYSMRKDSPWRQFQAFLFSPEGTDTLSWQANLHAAAGHMLLAEPVLREAPIPQSESRQLLTCNNKVYAELPRHEEPPAPNALTVFHRPDPDQLFFYSHPRPGDLHRTIELSATPGEYAVAAVGIYTPAAVALRLQTTPLMTSEGLSLSALPAACPVHLNARRDDYYGRGATWHWVADTLLPPSDNLATTAGQTQVIWLKVAVPNDAKSGNYSSRLIVKVDGLPDSQLPVHLRVYPFQLAQPGDKTFGLYADADRWKSMSDGQLLAELADFKAHGIDSLLLPDDLGQPQWQNHSVTGWQWSPIMLRAMPLIQKVGLRGPFRLWLEHLPQTVAKELNIKLDENAPAAWPDPIANAFRDALRAIKADFAGRNWGSCVFEGIDEPGYWKKGSPAVFAWQYKNAQEAGIPTYCTSSYLPTDPLGKFLDYHCYTGRCFDGPERSAVIIQATHQAAQKPWMYATGSYSGQVGNIIHNRFGSGFVFWRTGAEGIVSWTFQRPRGDPFNDFANPEAQPFITLSDPQNPGANLDTPQWEGLRQGWVDYRYAATASAAIANATRRGNPAAPTAQKEFDAILNQMPWDGSVFEDCPVTNESCDLWRSRLASLILRVTP